MSEGTQILRAGDVKLTIDPVLGGRMTSLIVGGHELLVTEGSGPIAWGCYPMAPFAGRIRDGRFRFGDRDVTLPRNLPPNAIHGTVFDRAWTVVQPGHLTIDLGPDWPFRGRADQRFRLGPDGLDATLTLLADEPMPASVGWHPWFRRRLTSTAKRPVPAASAEVVLAIEPGRMLVRGDDGLPTGEWTQPGPRPWDDCFTELAAPPRLTWPGILTVGLSASAAYWVVYDEPAEAICVEPQTEIPDFVNVPAGGAPTVVEPGRPLTATMSWRWGAA